MDTAKLLDRVKRLLALAGNNPNENEAAAAAAKAHELLAEHNLSMAEVLARGDKLDPNEERVVEDLEWLDIYAPQMTLLWGACARNNYCRLIISDRHGKLIKFIMVGRKINSIVAYEMATYLCATVKRVTLESTRGHTAKDKQSFLFGMVVRLCQRLDEMAAEQSKGSGGTGLALWTGNEQEENAALIARRFGRLAKGRNLQPKGLTAGYNAGRAAGDKVSLSRQLGGSKQGAIE